MIKLLKPLKRVLPASTIPVLDAAYARVRGRLVPRPCREPVQTEPAGGPPVELLIATASGLLHARRGELCRILKGYVYGLSIHKGRWWAFRRISERSGQLISFELNGDKVRDVRCEFTGLDPEVHQIDFIGSDLYATDTALNRVMVFDISGRRTRLVRTAYPAGRTRRTSGGAEYVHLNSVYQADDRTYLVFHNQSRKTGKPSEVAILDENLQLVERREINGKCAHNVALWRDELIVCDSLGGTVLIGSQTMPLGAFTRGLAIVDDHAFVGGSNFAGRTHRHEGDGNLFHLDLSSAKLLSQWTLKDVGSVYEIRAVAACDQGMSNSPRAAPVEDGTAAEHFQPAMAAQ